MDRESTGVGMISDVTSGVLGHVTISRQLFNEWGLAHRWRCRICDQWFEPFEAHEHKEIAA